MNLRIEIPGLPPKELSPNARIHFIVKAQHTAHYRAFVKMCAWEWKHNGYDGKWEIPDKAKVDVTFVVPDKRRRDKTNLASAFKAGLDGIVDAGIVKDDNYQCIDDQYHIEYRKGERLTIVEVTHG